VPGLKPIEFTQHAQERMASRGITPGQVEFSVRHPTTIEAGKSAFTQRYTRDFPPNRQLVVILEELPDVIRIVTTFWL